MTEAPARPLYKLVLKPEPNCVDPVRALRRLLKRALRQYGLRAVSCEETPPDKPEDWP
jgi:hypothetical protein